MEKQTISSRAKIPMNNILLILPNNPGDVLMGLEVASALKEKHPESKLFYAVDEESAQLVALFSQVDEVVVLPRKKMNQSAMHTEKLKIYEEFIEQILNIEFDWAINLFQDEAGAAFLSLVKALKKTGPQRAPHSQEPQIQINDFWTSYLWAIPAARTQNPFHAVDIYKKICGLSPRSHLNKPKDTGLSVPLPQRFWCFQVGSAWIGKRWPLEHFAQFINMCLDQGDFDILLIGSPEEQQDAQFLVEQCQKSQKHKIHNFCGKTKLHDVFSLLKNALGLITGDTFAMHAGALLCPVYALFGASSPKETGPYGAQHWIIQAKSEENENFIFEEAHFGLQNLSAQSVFDFIFHQKISPKIQVFQTQTHPIFKTQYLKKVPQSLMIEDNALESPTLTSRQMDRLFSELQELKNHNNQNASFASLKLSQKLMEAWQLEAEHSLLAEQYCILMNSLNFENPRTHISQRISCIENLIHFLVERRS